MIVKKTKKDETPKPKYNMAQNAWFMIKLAWTSGEKKVLVIALLTIFLTVSTKLVNLYVVPAILEAIEQHVSIQQFLGTVGGFVTCMMLLSAASAYVRENTQYGQISVRSELNNLLNRKAATTSYPNGDDEKFQKLQTKALECVNNNMSASEAIWGTLTSLLTNIIGFVFYAGLMSQVQPILIAVTLVTAVCSYYITNSANHYQFCHREEEAELQRHRNYLLERMKELDAAKDIKIFGLRSWMEEIYSRTMDVYTAFQSRVQGKYVLAGVADLILTLLRNGIAYSYLIGLILQGELEVSRFLLLFTAVSGFSEWINGILKGANTLHKQSLDISNVREYLEYEEPFRFEDGEPIRAEKDKLYEIRLEHVSFRYPGSDENVLSDMNLTLHPGEKLAVVGLNGAGKTTLVKLICGFLDPTEGRVLLDGKDIRLYNRSDYYTLFAAVFQDFSLLAGSIAVNIAQSEIDIDMERVKECIEKAGLRAKVESLTVGYETLLNREVYEDAIQLSGGETQRLMLARALYKDAPFIVLDEPTAALDPIAESELYHKYHNLTGNKSSIYISHRLASTRFCDRIIMIGEAGISEEGTHEQLLKAGGKYAELFEVQSRYYREGGAEYEEA